MHEVGAGAQRLRLAATKRPFAPIAVRGTDVTVDVEASVVVRAVRARAVHEVRAPQGKIARLELEVDEIGPSLRYATAQVTRAASSRDGGNGGDGGDGGDGGGRESNSGVGCSRADNDGDNEDDDGGYGGGKSDNVTTVTGTVAMGLAVAAVAKATMMTLCQCTRVKRSTTQVAAVVAAVAAVAVARVAPAAARAAAPTIGKAHRGTGLAPVPTLRMQTA